MSWARRTPVVAKQPGFSEPIGGNMKTFRILAAATLIPATTLLMPATALADTISSPGAGFVSVPLTFSSTTGSNGGAGAPFWNNTSSDGLNLNAGYFLTGSNPAMGLTNYLGSGSAFGNYLSTGGSGPDAAANFNFIQGGPSVGVTLLYTNAGANMTSKYGTQIGIYNVQDPSQKTVLFDHGTLYNPADSNGIYNNNFSAQSPFSVNTFANYGVYATTCGFNPGGGIYCDTFYSNDALNLPDEFAHQHFALFQSGQDHEDFYIGFEDSRGWNNVEGYGDFNDVIFRVKTDTPVTTETPVLTPEPATFSVLGLGLVGLGLLRRRFTSLRR